MILYTAKNYWKNNTDKKREYKMTEKFDFTDGAQFDPGFIAHMSAFVPSIQNIYQDLIRVKNFNQKKMKFKMYYNKIQHLIDTYIGFYLGCILWAACIKDLNKPVLNNLCYGGEYEEKEITGEVDFIRQYIEQYKKDIKYYLGQDYKIDDFIPRVLDEYEEFLKINKGFTAVQNTTDLQLNSGINKLTDEEKENILDKIAQVVECGDFKILYPLNEKLFTQKATV